jgi:tetratricopeptide (TPR) repeat protein
MNCYNCGARLNSGDTCPECGTNVKIYKKIIMASNAHYNEALKKVAVRDLSGAMESLNVSLKFSKTNTDARNLLGLIHFEMGEIVEALTEWVISKNYQPDDNIASRYIEEIQNDQARLASINQTIKKYNQALNYCHQDSRDLAIIQLKKVLSLNPKLVRGHQLLALLYIQEGRYDLAKKSLRNAGKIDANNTITLRYLKEANAGLRESNSGKKNKNENEDLISYQSGNETIIQPRYLNENTAFTTIINIFIGLVIGIAATYFLLIPGVRHQIQESSKSEVLEANNSIAAKNQQISSLESQIDDLTAQITDAAENDEQKDSRISSYEQLLLAYAAYQDGDIEGAGTALGNVNSDYLDDDAKTIYDAINSEVNAEYLRTMYKEGTSAYSSQDYDTAITDLTKVVELDETYENGNALYYLAQALRRNENLTEAKVYYQKFVELYPGTERAANAQNYISIEEE